MQYISTGLFNFEFGKALSPSDKLFKISENIEQIFEAISLKSMFGVIKITLLLLMICFVVLIIENFSNQNSKRRVGDKSHPALYCIRVKQAFDDCASAEFVNFVLNWK